MAKEGPSPPRDLAALEEKLAAHRRRRKEEESRARKPSAASTYGFGFRLVTELVVAVVAGFLAGRALDGWLGTRPWAVLIFVCLGMAAGILNVVRAAGSAEAQRHLDAMGAAAPEKEGENAPEDGKRPE